MQDTINSIIFEEELIELVETTENEENERELREGTGYIHYSLNCELAIQDGFFSIFSSTYHFSKYNSPIKSILTPPPDNLT